MRKVAGVSGKTDGFFAICPLHIYGERTNATISRDVPGAVDYLFRNGRTGQAGHKMSRPPFKGPVGAWIFEHISQETFDTWIKQGTKVINEMRLDLSRDQDADTYDKQMREYLGIDEEMYEKLMSGTPA